MYFDGKDNFWGVECIFVENSKGISIYPVNEKQKRVIFSHTGDTDFSLKYKCTDYKNSMINVHRMGTTLNNGFDLYANYVIRLINKEPTSVMEITGDAIDDLFNPVYYYYNKRRKGESITTNLLYDIDIVKIWDLQYKGKDLQVSLFYGEVLNRGITSDIKIHPKIRVVFPETNNAEEIYDLYTIIRFFLQVSRYGYNIGKTRVDLYSGEMDQKSYQGYLIDYDQIGKECSYSNVQYRFIEINIQKLLQFAIDNHNMQIDFFPTEYRSSLNDSYTGLLFATLYAAFERECHVMKEVYEKADDSIVKDQKEDIIKYIQEKKANSRELDWFYNGIIDRIKQFGTQIGQEQKIVNAYFILLNALQNSMSNIFLRHKDDTNGFPDKEALKTIARTILKFRGNVMHEGEKNSFSLDEVPFVRFLEILVYSMMLKRAEISCEEIEKIIGIIFNCNDVAYNIIMKND